MPKGRMINRRISKDDKVANISPLSALLYSWMIPHTDCEGRILAKSGWIKWEIVPLLNYFSLKKIETCIFELEKTGLICVYGNSREYLQLVGFAKNQSINKEREAPSDIPAPEQVLRKSGVTPLEVKVKAKEEVKDKVKYENLIKGRSPEFMEAWCGFLKERKSNKKEPTINAMCLLLKDLDDNLAPNDEALKIKIINKSTIGGYQGLFSLKGGYNGQRKKPSIGSTEKGKYDGIGKKIHLS